MDATSESRLASVYPILADKVRGLADALLTEGTTIIVVQGLRTVEQQQALYEQGRTTPGSIVTNAPGGHSYHNFGLAVDVAPLNPDQTIDWNSAHPIWQHMEQMAVTQFQLVSGANWLRLKDAPHLQLTGRFPEGAPDDELRSIYAAGGLTAVWQAVTDSLPTGETA